MPKQKSISRICQENCAIIKNKKLNGEIDSIYTEKKEVFGINYYDTKNIFYKKDLKENNLFAVCLVK